jgi:hypothetical protein
MFHLKGMFPVPMYFWPVDEVIVSCPKDLSYYHVGGMFYCMSNGKGIALCRAVDGVGYRSFLKQAHTR